MFDTNNVIKNGIVVDGITYSKITHIQPSIEKCTEEIYHFSLTENNTIITKESKFDKYNILTKTSKEYNLIGDILNSENAIFDLTRKFDIFETQLMTLYTTSRCIKKNPENHDMAIVLVGKQKLQIIHSNGTTTAVTHAPIINHVNEDGKKEEIHYNYDDISISKNGNILVNYTAKKKYMNKVLKLVNLIIMDILFIIMIYQKKYMNINMINQ